MPPDLHGRNFRHAQDGKTKPIKDIQVGDSVKATDPVLGLTLSEPVTKLHSNLDTDLTDLTVTANGQNAILHTTTNHPFWDSTTHHWTPAGQLKPGEFLETADSVVATVREVRSWTAQKTMLNLSINELHTYYVMAGSTPILVHNTPCITGVTSRSLGHYPAYVDLAKSTGAKVFSVPDDVWNSMSADEQWAANQKFLDRGIANGDSFLLATSVDDMRTDSYYAEELNYLMSQGYTFTADGTAMIPG